jgi:hypothetical protein
MTLAEALEQVDLEPGKTYRCRVRGVTVELKVCPELKPQSSVQARPASEPWELRDCDLKPDDAWVELPAPKPLYTIKLKKGPPMTAMVIDHTVDQIAPE